MKIYSYIVARDYGFAPNPFFGFCTLATCKPKIRKRASIGDWIIGTGAKKKYHFAGRLIYAMQVDETLNFESYWKDQRFIRKRPNPNGSLKQMYGDNIYHLAGERWVQADSHHSQENGDANSDNVKNDTKVDRMLIATKFVYWGKSAILIPQRFRSFGETKEDICSAGRYYRCCFKEKGLEDAFVEWLEGEGAWGFQGEPLEFAKHVRSTDVAKKSR